MTERDSDDATPSLQDLIADARRSFVYQIANHVDGNEEAIVAGFNNATTEIFALYQEACDALRATADDNARARRALREYAEHARDSGWSNLADEILRRAGSTDDRDARIADLESALRRARDDNRAHSTRLDVADDTIARLARKVGDLEVEVHRARSLRDDNAGARAELVELRAMFQRKTFAVDAGPSEPAFSFPLGQAIEPIATGDVLEADPATGRVRRRRA